MAPIERPDWGDGESRDIVPAQPVNLDSLPAGSVIDGKTMLASVQKPAPTGTGLSAELRASWEREGGFETNLKLAQDRAGRILGATDDAAELQSHFDGLPQSIQSKVIDVLRLSPNRTPDAALDLIDQLENSLTPAERTTAEDWLRKLSPAQKTAILYGLGAR